MRPTRTDTGAAKHALALVFLRDWSMVLDPALIADREVLSPKHEGDIMVEYGPDALIRYYCPDDPRLGPMGVP